MKGKTGNEELTMVEKHKIIKKFSKEYNRTGKKGKGEILGMVVRVTGYNRVYASYLLRAYSRVIYIGRGIKVEAGGKGKKRGRKRVYDEEVRKALLFIWRISGYMCGKRLAGCIGDYIDALERHKEVEFSESVKEKLLKISAATIDRMLRSERKRLKIRGRHGTKPGSILKREIEVIGYWELEVKEPGYIEVDMVHHCGEVGGGDFSYTLNCVDLSTGWKECIALKNKARVWVVEGIDEIRKRIPFSIRGLHSDNGSEFINAHLLYYCGERGIRFTRSRPYSKNDTCYIEEKNWSVVRKYVGYYRYDTDEEVRLLNELYGYVSLYENFFQPVMKVKEKVRKGGRVIRRYNKPQTPFRRLMGSNYLSVEEKEALQRKYEALNPVKLIREINRIQQKLLDIQKRKGGISNGLYKRRFAKP